MDYNRIRIWPSLSPRLLLWDCVSLGDLWTCHIRVRRASGTTIQNVVPHVAMLGCCHSLWRCSIHALDWRQPYRRIPWNRVCKNPSPHSVSIHGASERKRWLHFSTHHHVLICSSNWFDMSLENHDTAVQPTQTPLTANSTFANEIEVLIFCWVLRLQLIIWRYANHR